MIDILAAILGIIVIGWIAYSFIQVGLGILRLTFGSLVVLGCNILELLVRGYLFSEQRRTRRKSTCRTPNNP